MKRKVAGKKKIRKQLFDEAGLLVFASHLKKVRVEQGFTQAALADEAGMTTSQIGRIETAFSNPTLSTIFQIARALNVPPSRLFEFKLPPGPKSKN
ncbi:MAG: helix-turn-helix domain-containing protein [Bacteroidia bacterium]